MGRAASLRDHLNRRETLGLALSPCMRYLATGSEDNAAYLYDLRNGRVVHRLQVSRSSVVVVEGQIRTD